MPNLTIPSRARVRKDVQDVLTRIYWNSISECVDRINEVMQNHRMFVDTDNVGFSGESGYESLLIRAHKDYKYLCSSCTEEVAYPSFDNVLALSWYTMPSGKIEITAYIS